MIRQTATRVFFTRTAAPRVAAGRYMSGGSNVHGNDPEAIEKEMKRDKNEESVLKNAPGWSEVMASVSEANIKADQFDGKVDVEQTIELVRKKYDGYEKVTTTTKTSEAPTYA